jgi:para-aminobenzoate synthetase / 4-amino-4-deoxychorismate lyase
MAPPHRPDPNAGVFETLLVVDGCPVELDAHLARLGASVAELYGSLGERDPREAIEEAAKGLALGRLRANLVPDGRGGLDLRIVTAEVDPALVFPGPEHAVGARTFLLAGGLGRHKWCDRWPLEEIETSLAAEGGVPLIVDHGGAVLEASRASIFAASGGTVFTPPADGRILPGISRRRVLEAARAVGVPTEERELTVGDLIAADEVFLAGSVRGVEPVASIDGTPLLRCGNAGARIAAELRRAWLPAPAVAK